MISVINLVKNFGSFRAVDEVSFEVDQGDVLGFLGPNGAGKSTTMRMLTGFLPPSSGTASICGHDILTDSVEARKNLGYLPESAPAYADMTVREFLHFMGDLRGFAGTELKDRVAAAMDKCFLAPVQNKSIEHLSKGYRQRTCMAQALLHDPSVLVMDEPTDGLDPNQKRVVRDMIAEMSQDKAIILSTHVLQEVEAMCNRVVIISGGKVVKDSTPDALKNESDTGNLEEVFYDLTSTEDVALAGKESN